MADTRPFLPRRRILEAAKRANLVAPFHWLASDGWGKQPYIFDGVEDIAEGAITVELKSDNIVEFDAYIGGLTPAQNVRNPWFEEFWEDHFGCVLPHNHPRAYDTNATVCNETSRLLPPDA